MRNIKLYRTILGLTPPWTVAAVNPDVAGQQVVVQVDAGPGPCGCPECGTPAPRYVRKPRRWRHLNTCQFTTSIEADVSRVECPRSRGGRCVAAWRGGRPSRWPTSAWTKRRSPSGIAT